MSSPWDQAKPDLSKLPVHLRESLTAPVPVKPGEVLGRVSILTKRTGLNYPNARIWINPIRREDKQTLVIEFTDHRGVPQVMVEVRQDQLMALKATLAHCFDLLEGKAEVVHDSDTRVRGNR